MNDAGVRNDAPMSKWMLQQWANECCRWVSGMDVISYHIMSYPGFSWHDSLLPMTIMIGTQVDTCCWHTTKTVCITYIVYIVDAHRWRGTGGSAKEKKECSRDRIAHCWLSTFSPDDSTTVWRQQLWNCCGRSNSNAPIITSPAFLSRTLPPHTFHFTMT